MNTCRKANTYVVWLPALLLLFTAAAQSPIAAQDPVDTYIENQMKERHIPGLSLAVIQHGKVLKAAGYGVANVELSVKATPSTVYELASVTKQFTAAAIMLLVLDGKLSLEDPVTKYVTDAPDAWRGVTIRHLLTHTSGIPNHTELPVILDDESKDYTRSEILAILTAPPVNFQPGEDWAYNDSGYFLLGRVIEKASGEPYEQFMRERIFRPLRMTTTRGNILDAVIPHRAAGYILRDGQLRRGKPVSPTQSFAGGHLISTVLDLVKWDAGLADNKLLPGSVLQQKWTPAHLNNGQPVKSYLDDVPGSSYGFGWLIGEFNGHRTVEHGGSMSLAGFSSEILRFPDDGLTVIILCNRSHDPPFAQDAPRPWDIARGVAALYMTDRTRSPSR
jgi:CubicO group peptidase (beta-lactamase class C family)